MIRTIRNRPHWTNIKPIGLIVFKLALLPLSAGHIQDASETLLYQQDFQNGEACGSALFIPLALFSLLFYRIRRR